MKAGKSAKKDVVEKLKAEINAQVEDQDDVATFSF
jgi:hypothetical protein